MAYERKLHYDVSEWEQRRDTLGTYIKLRVWDDDGHEVSVITNRAGEGEWVEVQEAGQLAYRQTAGTLQFRLPSTKGAVIPLLARRFNERALYGWD